MVVRKGSKRIGLFDGLDQGLDGLAGGLLALLAHLDDFGDVPEERDDAGDGAHDDHEAGVIADGFAGDAKVGLLNDPPSNPKHGKIQITFENNKINYK